MIMSFKCPICGQDHQLIITSKLLHGDSLDTVCPLMHEHFKIKMIVQFSIPVSYEKKDVEAAEDEAELAEHQWRTEEGILFDKDSDK